ncbi:MAG: ribosome silencing factor [bacterium]
MQTEELAKCLARLIDEKKGQEIMIFDLKEISPITDYFVICTGLSEIHNRTIAESLIEYEKPTHIEGFESDNWVLLDFIDVIVHVFLKETRQFYGLDRLWGDAPQVAYNSD